MCVPCGGNTGAEALTMVSQCSSGDGLELGGGRNHVAAAVWASLQGSQVKSGGCKQGNDLMG